MSPSDFFAAAFEKTRAGLLLLDQSTGSILEANSAFLQMCRRARADVAGRIFWQSPLIADSQAGAEAFEYTRAGGSFECLDLPLETADGNKILLSICSQGLADGVVQLEIHDITAREGSRKAQRVDAQRTLAKRVAGEFHEMQRALVTATELLESCARRGQSRFHESDEIRKAGDRAGAIADELAAYSEESDLNPAPVELNELVESMRPALQRLLGPEIRLVFDLNPNVRPAMADPAKMRQILLKLAANSREAMERGGIFCVETRNASAGDCAVEDGAYAVLAVSDNGPGMDDQSWAHLYEPFFTTKAGTQCGLGLAAVHGIVRQSGGRLWADSAPGRGTSFRIYLPQAGPAIRVLPQDDGRRARGRRAKAGIEAPEAVETATT